MSLIKDKSLTGARTRDRTYAIYRILNKGRGHRISPHRLGIHAGVNQQSTNKYISVLLRNGLLEELSPPENYRKWRNRAVRTTSKGEEAVGLIRKLYELFDITLDR